MDETLHKLRERFPEIKYCPGKTFCWSPRTKEVFYAPQANGVRGVWSLLHETSHALLGHIAYESDLELVHIEVATWERTRQLAGDLSIAIDEDHIQDCLDTYRDWLYGRSICPQCNNKSLQQQYKQQYRCFNCHTVWKVTPSRFCRTYRLTEPTAKATPIFIDMIA